MTVHEAGATGFFRSLKGSLVAAALLLAWDGVMQGTFITAILVCPVWFVVSLLRSPIQRPSWGIAVAGVAMFSRP